MMEDAFVFDLETSPSTQEVDSQDGGVEEEVLSELMDELILGFCFETHRACKVGTLFLDETDEQNLTEFQINEEPGRDVFGQLPSKKQVECVCPNCNRNLSASRFAPHLEKCMGMGRNSSRIASKRIANSGILKADSDNDEDDRDIDWSFALDKKSSTKKTKKEKLSNNSPRRSKKGGRNGRRNNNWYNDVGGIPGADVVTYKLSAQPPGYEAMSLEDRKHLLMTTCGVISEHTKKMCTKSLRCPQHSDEQRRHVRRYLLGIDPEEKPRMRADGTVVEGDDVHVDIDSYEDGDGQALRDTLNRLQQWEGGNSSANPSPADSTSTTNSNSNDGKRRRKGGKLTHRKKSKQKPGVRTLVSSSTISSTSPIPTYEIID
ncbi:ataxin-7-like protein 3 [Amphiura filiformis]|uniref:ataxin-7-like protein 3 n=1 Tax=Amphiura filiformis TaxID=82378 RepID=UPI003B20CC6E